MRRGGRPVAQDFGSSKRVGQVSQGGGGRGGRTCRKFLGEGLGRKETRSWSVPEAFQLEAEANVLRC